MRIGTGARPGSSNLISAVLMAAEAGREAASLVLCTRYRVPCSVPAINLPVTTVGTRKSKSPGYKVYKRENKWCAEVTICRVKY